ncbi:MAG TPA: acetyl-CoA carboxylase biotin carboxylase subunit [Nitrososphaeraceae archaeon]|nr:acetyl-CoA carboxylase biotin carboxylase subunit [Nitrososphaeraceae archaeon]
MLKILIANRGEIAVRIAKTCKKLNLIPCGIYSDADQYSLHIKQCQDTINIGGHLPQESYLNINKIIYAAKKLGCDSIHPGYGFLSENSNFADICEREGFIFIGPSSRAMNLTGDKVKAKEVASKVSPVIPGREVSNENDAVDFSNIIGFPVMLKAVEGGGGRGLRIVKNAVDLKQAFLSSKTESNLSFGSDRIYIEKYIEKPRHIEVQILSDHSNIVHLGERECSIQRRHQKLIEETPSPALTKDQRKMITEIAKNIIKEMEYHNAGTIEFLFKDGKFYFMEVNARIQVEHPITEEVTGIDIIEQQLRIASGEGMSINQEDIKSKGHAIECRINAEHPINFVPYPGIVRKFIPPHGKNIRIDTALYSGYSIPIFYDSLISKLICFGNTRTEAIDIMKKSLLSFRISGVPSTIPFHISALNDRRFVDGQYDTSFVDEMNRYTEKNGEIAAAIFIEYPKKIQFVKSSENTYDNWMRNRLDWISAFDIQQNLSKWR